MVEEYVAKSEVERNLEKILAHTYSHREMTLIKEAINLVKYMPVASVVDRKKGHWIAQDTSLTRFMCSECMGKNYEGHEKFCPNCGADMRKGGKK